MTHKECPLVVFAFVAVVSISISYLLVASSFKKMRWWRKYDCQGQLDRLCEKYPVQPISLFVKWFVGHNWGFYIGIQGEMLYRPIEVKQINATGIHMMLKGSMPKKYRCKQSVLYIPWSILSETQPITMPIFRYGSNFVYQDITGTALRLIWPKAYESKIDELRRRDSERSSV